MGFFLLFVDILPVIYIILCQKTWTQALRCNWTSGVTQSCLVGQLIIRRRHTYITGYGWASVSTQATAFILIHT